MTDNPKRIQRQRTKGWRMPDGAVYVGRPSRWGNPINISDLAGQYPSMSIEQVTSMAVAGFRDLVRAGTLTLPNWRHADGQRGPVTWHYPLVEVVRAELAGHDLACWCPLDRPCHADVLLELANRGEE